MIFCNCQMNVSLQEYLLLFVYSRIICYEIHSWDQFKPQVTFYSSAISHCKYLKNFQSNAIWIYNFPAIYSFFFLDLLLLSPLFVIILAIASELGASACVACPSPTTHLLFMRDSWKSRWVKNHSVLLFLPKHVRYRVDSPEYCAW